MKFKGYAKRKPFGAKFWSFGGRLGLLTGQFPGRTLSGPAQGE
jgi:hypothetical protein